jgi:hypothetical protein
MSDAPPRFASRRCCRLKLHVSGPRYWHQATTGQTYDEERRFGDGGMA